MQEAAVTYRSQRATVEAVASERQSNMFTESWRLAVHGDRGVVTTELMTIGANGPTIGRVISTGHEIELREAEHSTFLRPSAGRLDIQVGNRDYRMAAGGLMAFRPTERRTRSSPDRSGQFRAATLQVPMDRMRDLAAVAETSADRAFAHEGVTMQGEISLFLARGLPQLTEDIFLRQSATPPARVVLAIGKLIDEQLCEMIEMKAAMSTSRRILPAYHRVRQAEEILYAHSDDPLSILEVAQALGVSLRSLQLAFNDVYGGLSPRDVLNRIRLEKARDRILAANGSGQVTTIAMDSGFFHLSRFAQAYAGTFGERPSETLARRRA